MRIIFHVGKWQTAKYWPVSMVCFWPIKLRSGQIIQCACGYLKCWTCITAIEAFHSCQSKIPKPSKRRKRCSQCQVAIRILLNRLPAMRPQVHSIPNRITNFVRLSFNLKCMDRVPWIDFQHKTESLVHAVDDGFSTASIAINWKMKRIFYRKSYSSAPAAWP